jgi:dTDP-4-dehydrorhamnose 3,5-epimerase
MKFTPLNLKGAYLIALEPRSDARGTFARAFCAREFAEMGLEAAYVQENISSNVRAGTLRGMHFQRAPHAEVKLVRCIHGAIFDAIVDLREESSTFAKSFGAELSVENGLMLYVPAGFAHGYQALSDGATAHYLVSAYYEPSAEGGVRYDDRNFGIDWPMPVSHISERDAAWPQFEIRRGSVNI